MEYKTSLLLENGANINYKINDTNIVSKLYDTISNDNDNNDDDSDDCDNNIINNINNDNNTNDDKNDNEKKINK
ncbi:hypothetical protein PIROE2DRAFT_13653 [Piromyces sp. E2]|nr:hypothetical protein PIROE2DRAFT_13653 [Piromyces sp. E2]|eukprot:OUM60567.1 hypothetical protein PIROE2DRAFT_13653 [Piromyces sp. E2]